MFSCKFEALVKRDSACHGMADQYVELELHSADKSGVIWLIPKGEKKSFPTFIPSRDIDFTTVKHFDVVCEECNKRKIEVGDLVVITDATLSSCYFETNVEEIALELNDLRYLVRYAYGEVLSEQPWQYETYRVVYLETEENGYAYIENLIDKKCWLVKKSALAKTEGEEE